MYPKKIVLFAFLFLSFCRRGRCSPGTTGRFLVSVEDVEVHGTRPGGLQDDDISGLLYGEAVVGYSLLPGLALGFDYRKGSLKLDNENASTEYDTTALGLNLSYSILYMINDQIWGTWVFDMEKEISSGGDIGDTFNGSGFRFGIGHKILPYISLNFEYASHTYDQLESAAGTTSSLPSITLSEVEHKEFILSVSMPFSFFMF